MVILELGILKRIHEHLFSPIGHTQIDQLRYVMYGCIWRRQADHLLIRMTETIAHNHAKNCTVNDSQASLMYVAEFVMLEQPYSENN